MIIIVPMFTVSAEAKEQPFSSLPTLAQLVQFVAGHPYLPSSRMNISFSAMVYQMQIHVSSAFDYPLSTAAMTNSGRPLILPLHASILVMEGVKGWGVNKKNLSVFE